MLGHPDVSGGTDSVAPVPYGVRMLGDNPPGADNQQETKESPLDPNWICGFVDGEGCFSVAIHRNPFVRRTRGWQLGAVFQVTQHEGKRGVLERLAGTFGCGAVRSKGPRSSVLVYSVSSLHDLEERIIPFFRAHPLHVKQADFDRFAGVVGAMLRKEHLEPAGFDRIVRVAYEMNAVGKQRSRSLEEVLLGSSETIRQAPIRG